MIFDSEGGGRGLLDVSMGNCPGNCYGDRVRPCNVRISSVKYLLFSVSWDNWYWRLILRGGGECLKDNLLSIHLLRRFSITRGIFDEVISSFRSYEVRGIFFIGYNNLYYVYRDVSSTSPMSCRIFSMIRVISRGYLRLSMLESIFSFFF